MDQYLEHRRPARHGERSVRAQRLLLRADHSIIREFDRECREHGPLYRISNRTCYQVCFAGVVCGIARAALDNFLETMRTKVSRGARISLRGNAVVQSNLAEAEVNLRAARGYLLQRTSTSPTMPPAPPQSSRTVRWSAASATSMP